MRMRHPLTLLLVLLLTALPASSNIIHGVDNGMGAGEVANVRERRLVGSAGPISNAADIRVLPSSAGIIYGVDNRMDANAAPNERVRRLSESVAAIFKATDIRIEGVNAYLPAARYGDTSMMCPGTRYEDEPNGARCSASLVGDDLMLTAGHCVKNAEQCATTRFVFGYAAAAGRDETQVLARDVYSCASIVDRDLVAYRDADDIPMQFRGSDWALIRLDRRVRGRAHLRVNRREPPREGDRVFSVGHPAGLPRKVAGGGVVRNSRPGGAYFVTNLDTFGGNSGSPVINERTGLIEGVLVRGERDYDFVVQDGRFCQSVKVCNDDGCRGEDVTASAVFAPQIPESRRFRPLKPLGDLLQTVGLTERPQWNPDRE
jgi:hypothetical protein